MEFAGERPDLTNPFEIDPAFRGVGSDQLHRHAITDVHPVVSPYHPTLGWRVQEPDVRTLLRAAGHDRIVLLTNAIGEHQRRADLAHRPLDLARRVLTLGAVLRQ